MRESYRTKSNQNKTTSLLFLNPLVLDIWFHLVAIYYRASTMRVWNDFHSFEISTLLRVVEPAQFCSMYREESERMDLIWEFPIAKSSSMGPHFLFVFPRASSSTVLETKIGPIVLSNNARQQLEVAHLQQVFI